MRLVQSAKLHGHDPWVYLKDVLERLLSHPNSRIDELLRIAGAGLPDRWCDAVRSRQGDMPGRLHLFLPNSGEDGGRVLLFIR